LSSIITIETTSNSGLNDVLGIRVVFFSQSRNANTQRLQCSWKVWTCRTGSVYCCHHIWIHWTYISALANCYLLFFW